MRYASLVVYGSHQNKEACLMCILWRRRRCGKLEALSGKRMICMYCACHILKCSRSNFPDPNLRQKAAGFMNFQKQHKVEISTEEGVQPGEWKADRPSGRVADHSLKLRSMFALFLTWNQCALDDCSAQRSSSCSTTSTQRID